MIVKEAHDWATIWGNFNARFPQKRSVEVVKDMEEFGAEDRGSRSDRREADEFRSVDRYGPICPIGSSSSLRGSNGTLSTES